MWIRRVLAVALLVIVTLLAPEGASAWARHGASNLTAHASDDTPRAGDEFTVHGRYTPGGHTGEGHVVKVQTYRNGQWLALRGARVEAQAQGTYRVRVILFTSGVRDLRVVGIAGADRPNSYHRIVVEVR
jgi:hypothetical protein